MIRVIRAKRCPFCGAEGDFANPPGIAIIVCGQCEAAGPPGIAHPTDEALTRLAAIEAWNRRAATEDNDGRN